MRAYLSAAVKPGRVDVSMHAWDTAGHMTNALTLAAGPLNCRDVILIGPSMGIEVELETKGLPVRKGKLATTSFESVDCLCREKVGGSSQLHGPQGLS